MHHDQKQCADHQNGDTAQYPDLFYRSLFYNSPDLIFYMDRNGVIALPNKRFSKFLGYPVNEIILKKMDQFLAEEQIPPFNTAYQKVLLGEKQYLNSVFVHKNGSRFDVHLTMLPTTSEHRVIGMFAVATDVTQTNRLKQSLIESEMLFKSITDSASFAIFIFQGKKLIYGNPQLYAFLGPELAGDGCILDMLHPDDQPNVRSITGQLVAGEKGIDFSFRTIRDGEMHHFDCSIKKILYRDKTTFIGSILEVTKRKKAEALTKYLIDHDELTDLPNSRFFRRKLDQELIVSKSLHQNLAVMYLDLERFKYINDTLGHPTGDELLKQFAKKLRALLDVRYFIARISADEFLILCPNIFYPTVVNVAETMVSAFDEPFLINDYRIPVSLNLGISIFPEDGDDGTTLLKHADSALHWAQKDKHNRYRIFTSTMDITSYKRFTLESDLRNSLDLHQFDLYYQPKVDLLTNQIVGAEALIRWNHPEWGLISPTEFIPLAEEIGVMRQIDHWIEETSCRQNKAWQDAGLPELPISVNLTANRFLENDLVTRILEILNQIKLDPHNLEVEIVETSLLENEATVLSILDGLRKNGIGINLDDFGTGYSSLSYLKRFKGKVDTLKIDKSFIDDLNTSGDNSSRFITQSIIDLAHHLNMRVVAEGVETQEQLQLLKEIKCDVVQGYLFSRPVPADQFANFVRKQHGHSSDISEQTRQKPHKNRRKFFRVALKWPLNASVTLDQFHGQKVRLGQSRILIENIGLGGLRFLSDLRFGIDCSMILKIETTILGKPATFYGSVVWAKELKAEIFQYGFEFIMSEKERTLLSQQLNRLAHMLKTASLTPTSDFVTTDKFDFFSKSKDSR